MDDQKHLVVGTKIKQQKPREVPMQGPCMHRKHLESKKYGDLQTWKRKGGRDRFAGPTSSTCSRWQVLRLLAGRRCHGERAHAGVRVRGRRVRSLCIAHTRDAGTESRGSAVEEGWEVEEAVYLGRANGTTCCWAEFWTEGKRRAGDRSVGFGLSHHRRKKFGVKTKKCLWTPSSRQILPTEY